MEFKGVVMAAGIGKRFQSATPKVFHKILGRQMVEYPIRALREAGVSDVVVVTQKGWEDRFEVPDLKFAFQSGVTGTAGAVLAAERALKGFLGWALVLNGDMPLVFPETLRALMKAHLRQKAEASLVMAEYGEPGTYGRVLVSKSGKFQKIVEYGNTGVVPVAEPRLRGINAGIYILRVPEVFALLRKVPKDKASGEVYLPRVFDLLARAGKKVYVHEVRRVVEVMGVNTRSDLAEAAFVRNAWEIQRLESAGVTIEDGLTTIIEPGAEIEPDVVIRPFTMIETGTRIRRGAVIGPFAHVRPGSVIGPNVHVGNFVEIKNSTLGEGTKANHLAYLGDATIGEKVNVGAGTITCNFDGVKKHPTVVGDGAFIGSDSILVAPVKIGKGAYTGAGSTITKDVPADSLGIERSRQQNLAGWVSRRKRRLEQEPG